MIRLALLSILLLGCAAPPEMHRQCPPLPELRAGASGKERRLHTQTIVRMYVACADGAHDR